MSIWGIYNRKGNPLEENDVEPLKKVICYFKQSNQHTVCYKQAAFGSSRNNQHHTVASHKQHCSENAFLFVANGRIDNREELFQALKINRSDRHLIDDQSLMEKAYLTFGSDTPNRLLGDWSFAAYDKRKDELFLAQSHHGYSALYYYIDDEVFIFSSSIKSLLAHPRISNDIDLIQIIRRDAVIFGLDADATFFRSIKLLNPAHQMWINKQSYRKERYWFPEKISPCAPISAENAAEELRDLFTDAVRVRLRGDGPVASMLSGGLDSGSVVSIAASLLRERGETLSTFSHVPAFDLSGLDIGRRTGNERPYIEATAGQHFNIITHFLDSSHMTPLEGMRMINDILNEPVHAAINAYWIVDILQQASHQGHHILLSGEMGNTTISFAGLPNLLGIKSIYQRHGLNGVFRKKLLRPLYDNSLGRWRKKPGRYDTWQQYSYLNPVLAEHVNLDRMIEQSGRNVDSNYRFSSHTDYILKMLMPGFNPRLRFGHDLGSYFGIEMRDPTGDKRIIEYILSLPNELFIGKDGSTKHILKLMMKDRLPDKVLYQKSTGLQSADISKRIQPDIPEINSIINDFSSEISEDEIFNKKRLLSDLQLLKEQKLNASQIHHLFRSVGIMEFLNTHK